MRKRSAWYLAIGLGFVLGVGGRAGAQDEFDIQWNTAQGNWSEDANWTGGFAPSADFEEGAYIGNAGTAVVDSAVGDVFNFTVPSGVVEFQQGGALKVTGSGDFARPTNVGAGGTLRFLGNGSLQTGDIVVGGRLELLSADANVDIQGDLNQRGTLHLDINGATPALKVGGDAQLGGSIVANFDNNTALNFGDSFEILSGASSVTNNGANVVIPDTVALPRGLSVQLTSDNSSAALTVGNLPILTLNRVSGATSIQNVVGGPLTLKSYTFSSDQGLLNADGWTSLNSQGNSDWTEANPRNEQITELNFVGDSTLEVGGSFNLGNAYNGGATHPRDEDVSFQFSTPDGRILDGIVEYEGPANDLVLRVDPESGAAAIQHLSSFIDPFDVNAYSILSASGALSVDGWNSFVDSGAAGDGWTEANPQSTALAELNLGGSTIFSTGTSIDLGTIFTPGSPLDVNFEFSTVAGDFLQGTVEYGPIGSVSVPGDCNGDGAVNAADLACVQTVADRDIVLAALSTLPGDLDGNGQVAFPDFLTLSNNFGQNVKDYTKGDIDLNGSIAFPDFLTLSNNFGKTPGAAAAVPEPASGMLGLLAVVGLLAAGRKRVNGRVLAAGLVVCLLGVSTVDDAAAVPFDGRFIRVDTTGPTGTIDNTTEAREIVKGNPNGAVFAEEVFGTVQALDLAGGAGNFSVNTPYLNGINNDSQDDILQYMEAIIEIPAGDWTIGLATDDGGYLRMPAVQFGNTFNENGATTAGDGELLYEGTRGHAWTTGQFTVPAGGIRTDFEALFFERGGGDSMEVAILSGFSSSIDGADIGATWTLLQDGALNWKFVDVIRMPGDFNFDGSIDLVDAQLLADNFGTGTSFEQGDNNRDGRIDLKDFVEFTEAFNAGQGAVGAAVPEPGSLALLALAAGSILFVRRRRSASQR